ncbi:MAG: Cysteine--tRNA ligase [Candidatus Anoxychlamydiales bacterium]|nr:Cysteine--tRNA ligase [Candidatus Anoxychlamydiales bacterium]HEU64823.1 cysteine--tRNA ligase [Chlamydiota bacterium]
MDIIAQLNLYNTQTRKKEKIVPKDGKTIRIYTCGPTVYDFAHIGNYRTYVFEDLLRRVLKYFGFSVTQVMNITDIEDKIIKGVIEKNISLNEFTEPFRQAFFEDLIKLNIEKAEFYPKATHYIENMIDIIVKLVDKKIAYKGSDGSIYFSIDKFKDYGKLSHLDLKSLKKGASKRVSTDEYEKENISDFVLWKAYDQKRDGEIFWNSPFGKGRPGWHIECSAMALKLLGSNIDIHCGGVDNIFPHHENEIAQSESFTNERFVLHWAHSEHLIVDGKKMSKSLGNFYTLRDLISMDYTGRDIRYMLLNSHYRMQLNFTFEGLKAAKASIQRILDFVSRLKSVKEEKDGDLAYAIIKKEKTRFIEALSDDLNISLALSTIFDLIREINHLIDDKKISKKEALKTIKFLKEIDKVLGFIFIDKKEDIPKLVQDALEKRIDARKNKNFTLADELRDFIFDHGYVIEDMPDGARLKKK